MCNFCNNILKISQYRMIPPWERKTSIVKYTDIQDSNKYGLWIECEDSYYSSIEMDVNYCPICGRKLNEN